MSEFVIPVVGQCYQFGHSLVTVTEAIKKRFWRIKVREHVDDKADGPVYQDYTIPQAEWAAKASHVGAQE